MNNDVSKDTPEGNKFRRERPEFKEKIKCKVPIRPIIYPDHVHTILGDSAVTSNIIGKDNKKILGLFCYDADKYDEECDI